jgi:hypothetical protein
MLIGRIKSEIESRSKLIRAAFRRLNLDSLREQLFQKQFGICPACNKPMQSADSIIAQIDHGNSVWTWASYYLPIEDAIKYCNAESNLILLHARCNGIKNSSDIDEFLEWVASGQISLDAPMILTSEYLEIRKRENFKRNSARQSKIHASRSPKERSDIANKSMAKRSATRMKTAHTRWHTNRGIFKPECVLCPGNSVAKILRDLIGPRSDTPFWVITSLSKFILSRVKEVNKDDNQELPLRATLDYRILRDYYLNQCTDEEIFDEYKIKLREDRRRTRRTTKSFAWSTRWTSTADALKGRRLRLVKEGNLTFGRCAPPNSHLDCLE